ncbi:MAG: FAD-dependent oxidoreductase [Planctomycetota bacterium]
MSVRVGVLVVGGGVCGLWTLWSLLERGHDAWLIESASLGAGQTLASQGILHAGVKYRLPGNTADSSRSVADVQPVWEAALRGEAGPNLASVPTISAVTHLWSLPTLGARMAAEIASRVMRSGTKKLNAEARPGVLNDAPDGVSVFEAPERVLEPLGLVVALRAATNGRARAARCSGVRQDTDGFVCETEGGQEVLADAIVFAAGEGNEALIRSLGVDAAKVSQRRPLHQVVGRGVPGSLNGHCLQASDKPVLTVTTGSISGEATWYLGGDLAETGVGLSSEDQCQRARDAIERCLGWVDTGAIRWSSFKIDRAEGKTEDGRRPDGPVIREIGHTDRGVALAVWPTKLVLAPVAAQRVADTLGPTRKGNGLVAFPDAEVAKAVW